MSSWESIEVAIRKEDMESMATHENQNTKEATFEYVSATTGLRIQHRITVLTNIFEQDLLKWVSNFREIARMCNWSDEAKVEVLTQVISCEIQSKIGPRSSSEKILSDLLRLKYNSTKAHHYYLKLANIKQRNFIRIKAYANKISEICNKLGICCNWSAELIKEKVEEAFFLNLEGCVKMEMAKLSKNNMNQIYETIEKVENMIIEEMYTKNKNTEGTKNHKPSKNTIHNRSLDHNKTERMTKFCDLHQSKSHSNEECRKQKKQENNIQRICYVRTTKQTKNN
ncbi:hypothetical protein EQH57_0149 [Dictyocoela roeselum]|nr:hypothetical protein EQH57_0149 [Dictyocoela roeselum]